MMKVTMGATSQVAPDRNMVMGNHRCMMHITVILVILAVGDEHETFWATVYFLTTLFIFWVNRLGAIRYHTLLDS